MFKTRAMTQLHFSCQGAGEAWNEGDEHCQSQTVLLITCDAKTHPFALLNGLNELV